MTDKNRGNAGKGRPKGSRNKLSGQLKEMVLTALDDSGGVDYLVKQAEANPAAFLTLLGKVLPMTIAGDPDSPLAITEIRRVIVHAADRQQDDTQGQRCPG